jgi:hypothetical protein
MVMAPAEGQCRRSLSVPDTQYFQILLDTLAKKYRRRLILLFMGGVGDLKVPTYFTFSHLILPSPNPQENRWHEIREKNQEPCTEIHRRSLFSSRRPHATSNATRPSSNPSHHSPISSTQSDVEVVSDGTADTGFKKNVCKAGTTTSNRIGPISMPPTMTVASGRWT